tara:strand:- start:23941 stop:24384 length:444 start_codon:yes stop_codon:yes gene_type:complete
MVLTRSQKAILNSKKLNIFMNTVCEDLQNYIRTFLLPKCNIDINKDDYKIIKDNNGGLKIEFKPKHFINLNTFILNWNDVYKTKKYHMFLKYIATTNFKLMSDKMYKRYFVKWLNSTCNDCCLHTYYNKDDVEIFRNFRNYINTISF